jgi:hypothetical protein
MTKLTINIGNTPNDRQGDSLRAAFTKINANFDELYENITNIEIGEVTWESVTGKPVIPADLSDLTDNQGLLADSFDGGGAASEYDEEQTIDGGQA